MFLPFVVQMVPRTGLVHRQVPIEWTLTGMWAKPFSLSNFFSLSVWIWSPSSDQVFDQSICLGQSATSIFRIIDRHREKNYFNRIYSCENTILKKIISFCKNGNVWGSKRKLRWRRGLNQGKFELLKSVEIITVLTW